MKITILAVGRIKERFYEDAIREYSKRLSRYVNLCIEEVPDEAVPEKAPEAVQNQILQKEADRLEKVLDRNPGAYVTALAIEGKMYDSVSFSSRMADLQVSGKSALAKAVRYALHEKPFFYTFLQNGNVPPDNNRAENAIRPFAIGRKNWLFSNTANGAKASAVLYSIAATAQANGVDTEQYLTELFSQPVGTISLPFNT